MGKRTHLPRGKQRTRICKRCRGTGKEWVPPVPATLGMPGMKAHLRNCDRCQGRGTL